MGFTHLLLLFGRKLCSFWVVNNGLRTKLENFPTKQCFLQRRRKKSRLQKRVQGWNPNFKILSTMISPRVEPQKFIRIFTVLSEALQSIRSFTVLQFVFESEHDRCQRVGYLETDEGDGLATRFQQCRPNFEYFVLRFERSITFLSEALLF